MKSMGALLKAAREAAGMSVEKISSELESRGIKASKKTIYSWESGKSQPNPDPFLYMCGRYGIVEPLEYFGYPVTDDGAPCQMPPYYRQLAKNYRSIVDRVSIEAYTQQEAEKVAAQEEKVQELQEMAEGKRPYPVKEKPAAPLLKVVPPPPAQEEEEDNSVVELQPFFISTQPASAGHGFDLGPQDFQAVQLKRGSLPKRAKFGIPVRGDSMEPLFHDGDILIIGSNPVELGQIGVFTINGEGYVKKLGKHELLSLNPAYRPIPFHQYDRFTANGRVIGVLDPVNIVSRS